MLTPDISTFASIQIKIPAGSATETALPKTNKVLSNKERIITFPTCGVLYGGSSKVNEEGSPLSNVFDNILETIKVKNIPSKITKHKISTLKNEEKIPLLAPIKNIVIIDISVGKRPLQGTKLFVKIAINRSLLESIILHPVTPQALQPNPIHIVSACFPHAEHFLNVLSKLKAILGKYPKSSRSVKSGKNIAIGGSITATTQVKTLYAPDTINPWNPIRSTNAFE